MVARKRLRRGGDSDDSDSDRVGQALPPSPLTREHDDDVAAMIRMRKKLKPTTKTVSSSASKMNWSRNDELVILGSIVDYEKETKLSYKSDWAAFHGYVKDFIEANFSKQQLMDKIKNLKKRFTYNQARSSDGKGPSFTSTEDDEIFKLSVIIWATNETWHASNENIDQAKDVAPCAEQERVDENMDQENVDVPCVEHERVNGTIDQQKDHVPCVEHERVTEKMDQENVDVPYAEHERVSNISSEIDKGEKEKSKEEGVDEFCALEDALEAATLYQSLGRCQQKLLLQNLKNLGAQRRKELTDEWKALLAEELKLYAKKLNLSAKLAEAGDSS